MPRQLRVFLCHASQDKPAVRELYKRLKAEAWIDPWLDEEKLSFGQHWTTTIEDALSDADVVIMFLSRNSVQKEGFVQRELNYAWELSLEKPRNVIFLIPFRLDDCQIPRYLGSRQWGDYFGDKKDGTYQILLRSLKQRHQQKLKLEAEEQAACERIEPKEIKPTSKNVEKQKPENSSSGKNTNSLLALLEAYEEDKLEKKGIEISEKLSQTPRKSASSFFIKAGGIIILLIFIFAYLGRAIYLNNLSITKETPVFSTFTKTPVETETPISLIHTPTTTPINTPANTVTAYPILGIGSAMTSEIDGMVLDYVPAGEFMMGSNSYLSRSAAYTHQVNLDAFWIDQTEVTNAMYEKCVKDSDCTSPTYTRSSSRESYYGNSQFDDYPVIYINWYQANAYCEWASRRLSTEAEWEKAARGTDGRTFPWGGNISCLLANYWGYSYNCGTDTHKVGENPSGASPYGVLDMEGNVWEWVSSLYQPYPYKENDGRESLDSSGARVIRGSWTYWTGADVGGYHSTSADRLRDTPTLSSRFIGFRCAIDATP
ncbi:hypothetical protein MASR2M66_22450 [Chloroflexota bacterium]